MRPLPLPLPHHGFDVADHIVECHRLREVVARLEITPNLERPDCWGNRPVRDAGFEFRHDVPDLIELHGRYTPRTACQQSWRSPISQTAWSPYTSSPRRHLPRSSS